MDLAKDLAKSGGGEANLHTQDRKLMSQFEYDYRQVQFLDHAKQAFAAAPEATVSNCIRIVSDLLLPTPALTHERKKQPASTQNLGYAAMLDLLQTPVSALADADWLATMKNFLSFSPELYDEVKDAFGIRDKDDMMALASSTIGDTSEFGQESEAGGATSESGTGARISRRPSRSVTWDRELIPGEQSHTRFPPTPIAGPDDLSPFENIDYVAPPSHDIVDDPFGAEDLSYNAMPVEENPELCLTGQCIAYDLHVAMMDRPAEMRDLASRNAEFFQSIAHCCCNHNADDWAAFEQDVLYAPREQMDDLAWIRAISKKLKDAPSLLATLKELVGYDHHDEIEEEMENLYSLEAPFERHLEAEAWFRHVVKIREHPEIMSRLENDYPQFFANCKKAMEGESRDDDHPSEYDQFLASFFSSRTEVPDDVWETDVRRFLARSSNLLDQLRDIALYELEIDESELQPVAEPTSSSLPAVDLLSERLGDLSFGPDPFAAAPEGSADLLPSSSLEHHSEVFVRARSDPDIVGRIELDNPNFLPQVRRLLGSEKEYTRFVRVLQYPRTTLPDDRWESLIAQRFLGQSRELRELFREVVGAHVMSTGESMDSDDEEWEGKFHVLLRDDEHATKLASFESDHPELCDRVRGVLGGDAARVEEFWKLVKTPRTELDDDKWAERVEDMLEDNGEVMREFLLACGLGQIHKSDWEMEYYVSAPSEEGSPLLEQGQGLQQQQHPHHLQTHILDAPVHT
ncbi:hypothetical protein HK104_004674, partial [Borealophlyctis nickersoniae]